VLDLDEELQRELEQLVCHEVAELLPGLAMMASSTGLSNRARHDAIYRVLTHLLEDEPRYRYHPRRFHQNPAWPYETPLRLVDDATQLYEDFQTVLPEIREVACGSCCAQTTLCPKGPCSTRD
jgi:hypothetical protein